MGASTRPQESLSNRLGSVAPSIIALIVFLGLLPLVGGTETPPTEDQLRADIKQADELVAKGKNSYPLAIRNFRLATESARVFRALPDTKPKTGKLLLEKVLYKLGEVLQLSHDRQGAFDAFSEVLLTNPDHKGSRTGRLQVAPTLGELRDAAADAEWLSKNSRKPADSAAHLETSKKLMKVAGMVASSQRVLNGLRDPTDKLGQMDSKHRRAYAQHYSNEMKTAVHTFPDADALRLLHADLALEANDHDVVREETTVVLSRSPDTPKALYLRAQAFKLIGGVDAAKRTFGQCIDVDKTYAPCRTALKVLKDYMVQVEAAKAAREKGGPYNVVAASAAKALAIDPNGPESTEVRHWLCGAFKALKKVKEGLAACTEALQLEAPDSPDAIDVYLDRAELHLMNDDTKAATEDIDTASRTSNGNQGQGRIQQLRKQLERLNRKDLYKILGVKRTANAKEIRSAYRKLAMELHPDRIAAGTSDEERQQKLDMFEDINLAKSILLDDERRSKYDRGEQLSDLGEAPERPPPRQGGFNFFFRQ